MAEQSPQEAPPLYLQDPGSHPRPGSLIEPIPAFHLLTQVYLFVPPKHSGGAAQLLPEEAVTRWNQGADEAAVLVAGKARLAVLLEENAANDTWWVLPLFSEYVPRNLQATPVVRIANHPKYRIHSSFVDLRKSVEVPTRFVEEKPPRAQLTANSLGYLLKRFASHFLRDIVPLP